MDVSPRFDALLKACAADRMPTVAQQHETAHIFTADPAAQLILTLHNLVELHLLHCEHQPLHSLLALRVVHRTERSLAVDATGALCRGDGGAHVALDGAREESVACAALQDIRVVLTGAAGADLLALRTHSHCAGDGLCTINNQHSKQYPYGGEYEYLHGGGIRNELRRLVWRGGGQVDCLKEGQIIE